jgi:hypothetical protein
MSNYTKTTNFLRKDSLPDTDTEKIIRGSEFDTEFNNLMTSVNSKANLNSPDFIGTPKAPTAPVGTNSRQLATCEFVTQNAMVSGMIVMWAGAEGAVPGGWILCNGETVSGVTPPDLRDRFVMGASAYNRAGYKGGYKDAYPVNHTHGGSTNTTGNHTHSGSTTSAGVHKHTQMPSSGTIYGSGSQQGAGSGSPQAYTGDAGAHTHGMALNNAGNHAHSITTGNPSGGVSKTGRNLPPYYALAFIMKV